MQGRVRIAPGIRFTNTFRRSLLSTPVFQRAFLAGWLLAAILLGLRCVKAFAL